MTIGDTYVVMFLTMLFLAVVFAVLGVAATVLDPIIKRLFPMANQYLVNDRVSALVDHLGSIEPGFPEWDVPGFLEATIREAETVDALVQAQVPERLKAVSGLIKLARKRLDEIHEITSGAAGESE